MGRVKKVEIQESAAELLRLMRQEKRPLVQARLQALYLYRSGQVTDYEPIGQQVGYERHTVGKWFSLYRQKGLSYLLSRFYEPLRKQGKVKDWKLYFQDESRFGLMTVLRRAITSRGVKPIGPYSLIVTAMA